MPPPIGTRTVFVEEVNNSGQPVQKFGRTNTYNNKVVHTVGVSQNSDDYSVVQLIQNNHGHLYKRQFVLPEQEIMKLLSLPDVLVPLEEEAAPRKRTVRKTTSKKAVKKTTKKTAKKTAKKAVKKTLPKKTAKKAVKKTLPKKKTAKKKVVRGKAGKKK